MKMVAPLDLVVRNVSRELKNLFTSLEVGYDGSIVFAGAYDKTWVREAPRE